jgi:long-chain acyl-CoA synthetase
MDTQQTIPGMFFEQAERYRDRAVMKVKRQGRYEEIPWNGLANQIEELALSLIDLGVAQGDRVAILSENRPEWAVADLAILSVGAVTVPIYTTLTSGEIEYILRDAGVKWVFVSTTELMAKLLSFHEALGLKIVLFDAPIRVSGPKIWWMGELIGLGKTAGPLLKDAFHQRRSQLGPEDLASIIYTSGTTGPPKGVMLTHRNFLSNCNAVHEVLPVGEEDLTLSFLPLSHVFERMAGYYFVLYVGGTIAYAENMETVATNLLEVRPTILTGVPRFYEKVVERVRAVVQSAPPWKRWIFHWAERVGQARIRHLIKAQPVPAGLNLQYRLADRLVFAPLRMRLGGRLRFAVSGGAPLSKEIAEFFYMAGILILEGYGLTETSPVISVNRPDRFRFGTVGLPIPGVEVRIAEDGEILTRGPHVMKGYFNLPQATQEVLDRDGWFHTGDIGSLDADGFLTITDRKKDLIKTSGGKMVAPQNLEQILKSDPYIADAMVVGDRKKYITALVVPDMERLKQYAHQQAIPFSNHEDLVRNPSIQRFLFSRVQKCNEGLAPFEQIKKIAVLSEPFSIGGGELTPTLKVKRRVVAERYAAQIEALYAE